MLKKVMSLLASKYLAIKDRIRAIETHLMIQSLLLRDKKMIRHLFQQRKHLNLSNKVKDDNEYQPDSIEEEEEEEEKEDYVSESNGCDGTTPLINSSIAATPASMVQVAHDEDEDLRCVFEDEGEGEVDECVSVIEMVKNAKEGRGKKFVLEDDIDKVADLFIQRFHHQILKERISD